MIYKLPFFLLQFFLRIQCPFLKWHHYQSDKIWHLLLWIQFNTNNIMKIVIICKRWAAPTTCVSPAPRCWHSCLSLWKTQRNWGVFRVICLRFSADRINVITGKCPTTLKSVCSPWTLVKCIASLRQIAVNDIAAFWLDTDGKKIVLKKNNWYYPSSVHCLKSGLLQLFSLG